VFSSVLRLEISGTLRLVEKSTEIHLGESTHAGTKPNGEPFVVGWFD
jgi:hypothetical protein